MLISRAPVTMGGDFDLFISLANMGGKSFVGLPPLVHAELRRDAWMDAEQVLDSFRQNRISRISCASSARKACAVHAKFDHYV